MNKSDLVKQILSKNNKNELFFKFLNSDSNNKILTRELTKYFDNFLLFIEDMTLNSLTKGVFNFNYKE